MNADTLAKIKIAINKVEQSGFGEVVIKIQNGYPWRIITTCDTMIGKKVGEACPQWEK